MTEAYTLLQSSADLAVATENEDTWIALRLYDMFQRNLTAFALHQQRSQHRLCSALHPNATNQTVFTAPCEDFNASLSEFDVHSEPVIDLVLPTRAAAAAFSMETIYHPDPMFMHQSWTYFDPLALLNHFSSTLALYSDWA
jgi:hypothetical protein